MQISTIVSNEKQLNILLKNKNIDEIVIDRDCFDDNLIIKNLSIIKNNNKNAYLRLERISRYDDNNDLNDNTAELINNKNIDGLVLQNFDSFIYVLDNLKIDNNKKIVIEIDYGMNIINNYSKQNIIDLFDQKINHLTNNITFRFVSPVELNNYEIIDLKIDTLIVYGYIPTMVTANCLFKTLNKCDKKNNTDFIKDRMNNNIYFRAFCKYCYNKIYNIAPLYLVDIIDSLKDAGFDKLRYDFSIEKDEEIDKILNKNYIPKNFTRGHIKNKII